MIGYYFRLALASFRRTPGITALMILAIAIGIVLGIVLVILAFVGLFEIIDGFIRATTATTILERAAGMMGLGFGVLTLSVSAGACFVATVAGRRRPPAVATPVYRSGVRVS